MSRVGAAPSQTLGSAKNLRNTVPDVPMCRTAWDGPGDRQTSVIHRDHAARNLEGTAGEHRHRQLPESISGRPPASPLCSGFC